MQNLIGRDDPTIVQIGSNTGRDTNYLIKIFPKCSIHCFEPDPRCLDLFRQNVNYARCYLHPVAISSKCGTCTFYQSGGEDHKGRAFIQQSSIRKPHNHIKNVPDILFPSKITVSTIDLDSWYANVSDTIDFLRADMQGAEEDLILGAEKTLKNIQHMLIEYADDESYQGQINSTRLQEMLPEFKMIEKFMYGTAPPLCHWGDMLFSRI